WIPEPELLEVLVDARVRAAGKRLVCRPCHFERRKVLRIGSRAQQPHRSRGAVLDLDPYGLHRAVIDVDAEHAAAVLCAQHGGAHAHVLIRGADRTAAQGRVADAGGRLPGSAAGEREHEQDPPRIHRMNNVQGKTSISASETGWRSNSSTARCPS